MPTEDHHIERKEKYMNPKYEKVCAEIAKIEKKVEDLQAQLKELRSKKTEMENLEIINTVRAMVMDKDQIMAFLSTMKGGAPQPDMTETEVSDHA
jgi:peptidoglycan hydrolase CwlO-like protein